MKPRDCPPPVLAVIVTLLALTGCRTPCPRGALGAPPTPAIYAINNGRPFWVPADDAIAQPPRSGEPSEDASPEEIPAGDGVPDESADGTSPSDDPDTAKTGDDDRSAKRSTLARFIRTVAFQREREPADPDADEAKTDDDDSPDLESIDRRIEQIEAELSDEEDDVASDATEDAAGDPSDRDNDPPPSTAPRTLAPIGIGDAHTAIDGGMIDSAVVAGGSVACMPRDAFYADPYLSGLIAQALVGNQELRILSEEIRIASNEAYSRSGEYRPFVSLGATAGLDKVGQHTREGAVEENLPVAPGQPFPDPLGDFLVAADVSWEIDIWNRLRNAQRAAAVRYLATAEGRNYTVTRLVAEIAENYYRLQALDTELEILQMTIDLQRQSLRIAVAKKEAGRGTELAVQRFAAEVQRNSADVGLVRQEIVETENRINFLVGRYPQPIERPVGGFLNLHLSTLSSGVPSELLQNRADIRQAQREIAAAGLDVQVAKARFYPSLSLTAGLGWNAFSTGYLFRTPESLIYSVAGGVVGPLINRRAIQADYRTANARQLQAVYEYQQTVLEAHIEVVDRLTRVENLRRSLVAKRRQLESLERSVDVAQRLFQNARAEYVEVLLAQRELMDAGREIVDLKSEQLSAIVNAYQALGGGGF